MTHDMMILNGSQGEGGGQILRTSLALSLVTGKPFRLENIRAKRKKPGLLRQHLTAVEAARTIGRATTSGAELGSTTLVFQPGTLTPGDYAFDVGSAGSALLVLQAVLPALLTANGKTSLTISGGTHNPFAPPFEFLDRSFAPMLHRMGANLQLTLDRAGFYPAGGGRVRAIIETTQALHPIHLPERGPITHRRATAIVARISPDFAQRQLELVREHLGWATEECYVGATRNTLSPGNALVLEVAAKNVTAVFTSFGQRSRSAEYMADEVSKAVTQWLKAEVPVDEHLADQLLLPMALAGGGSFLTTKPSSHTLTNAQVIQQFLPTRIHCEPESSQTWRVEVDAVS
jgi:RNA 3'-terminal phosphate cyclase (ATP)